MHFTHIFHFPYKTSHTKNKQQKLFFPHKFSSWLTNINSDLIHAGHNPQWLDDHSTNKTCCGVKLSKQLEKVVSFSSSQTLNFLLKFYSSFPLLWKNNFNFKFSYPCMQNSQSTQIIASLNFPSIFHHHNSRFSVPSGVRFYVFFFTHKKFSLPLTTTRLNFFFYFNCAEIFFCQFIQGIYIFMII